MNANRQLYLLTPPCQIKQFTYEADREYFSRPVPVELHHSSIDGVLYVLDPARNHTYPVNKSHIKTIHQLTNKQRAKLQ